MTEIKAIPTRYKGYHFRSRLEARWAVFFDALGIKWEYEPEGFQLDNGDKYLPDFYFPEFKIYAEIKPSNKSEHKCDEFFNSTGHPIVLLSGIPISESPYKMWCFHTNSGGGGDVIIDVIFSRYPEESEGRFPLVNVPGSYSGLKEDAPFKFMALEFDCEFEALTGIYEKINIRIPHRTYAYHDITNSEKHFFKEILTDIYGKTREFEYYENISKSARFEHGESGAT